MEQKNNALKTSSKVISVLMKIGYTAMIVMICICAAMLIFLGVTGGTTSSFKIGETDIIIFDGLASTPEEIAATCAVLFVTGIMLFVLFMLSYRMFHKISLTGEPFEKKYVNTVRAIGILTVITPFAIGFAHFIATLFTDTQMPEVFDEMSGIVVGAIIFCLSYIIDYGCGIRTKLDADSEEKPQE